MTRIVDFDKARRAREKNKKQAPRPPSRTRRLILRILIWIAVIAAIAVAANWRTIWGSAPADGGLVGTFVPVMRGTPETAPAAMRVSARHFPICGGGQRIDCVVDGDTIWLDGRKIRIADIDTPEVSSPSCAAEKRLGDRATVRLQSLLNAGPIEVRAQGRDEDRYGRKLRTLHRDGRSLGESLVAEGLAHRWNGSKQSWCG